jgi:ABC-type branched-subunit amino acid transport system substrate-binding protein
MSPTSPDPFFPAIGMDDRAAARQVVEHLFAQGHSRIGHISGHPDHAASTHRRNGFFEAYAARGLPRPAPELFADGEFTFKTGVEAAKACPVVGVPSPADFPKGPEFVASYNTAFGSAPGTWSPYTYDSLNMLAAAATAAGGFDAAKLTAFLNTVKDWPGVTGSGTIDPANGNREPATVVFLDANDAGEFHVDKAWATAVGASY